VLVLGRSVTARTGHDRDTLEAAGRAESMAALIEAGEHRGPDAEEPGLPQAAPRAAVGRPFAGREPCVKHDFSSWKDAVGTMTGSTMTSAVSARTATRRVRPGISPGGLAAVIGLGAGLVLLWWWVDTPPISGWGNELVNASRITGLLAGYGIAVQLLLMSRIPWLDRGLGTDRLAHWHAMGGRYVISLAVVHTLAVIWGYAAIAHTGVVGETGTVVLDYPDVAMATVALGLFVLVGVLSARAVRRRVRYETWYYLHFYTYLALALAFAHVFAVGADFITHPLARALWLTLYLGVGLLLLYYRVLVPVLLNRRHRLRVGDVVREGPGVVSVVVRGQDLDRLNAQPGQFFRWRFLTRGGWWQSHPWSLSAAPHPKVLRLTVKNLGDYSGTVGRLRKGTRVWVEGPYGAVTPDKRTRRRVLLLAGGIGITAIRTLAEALPGGVENVLLLYRVNEEREIVFRRELDWLTAAGRVDVRFLVGPPRSAADVLVGGRLRTLVPDVAARDVFVCGPPGFVTAARTCLVRSGVPHERIHVEQFALL
jgi:predicted ferric reductase